jgi:hypothetical protein
MKKLILSFAMVMLVSTMATFSQMTNTEIHRVISQSRELNKNVTSSPDSIWPGQRLSFLFSDGYVRDWVVSEGETETFIVKEISRLENIHGSVIAPDTTAVDSSIVRPVKLVVTPVAKDPFPWWVLIGFVILVFVVYELWLFLGKATKETKKTEQKQKYVDPTKAGFPFVAGGVKPENAENHFRDLTLRNTAVKESNIVIRDIRPVFLSTKGGLPQTVDFANGASKELSFRNFPGFAGLVSRNKGKNFTEEYFLEGCGNPVYRKESFLAGDGLIISDKPIKFGDEEVVETKSSTSEEAKAPEVEAVNEKPVVEEVVKDLVSEKGSDLLEVSVDHVLMVERLLAVSPNIHRVSTKFVNSEGSVETIFETKNVPIEKAKKE